MKVLRRFIRESDGLEIVEWALLGAVFALAAALVWSDLGAAMDSLLGTL
jgi:Flp pilus assembly pilin Flp